MVPELITRDAAKAAGLKRFFTGEACRKGHLSARYVSIGSCCECMRELNSRWNKAHPGAGWQFTKKWAAKNPEKAKVISDRKRTALGYRERTERHAKERYAANPELAKKRAQDWYFANYEHALANAARWRAENKEAIKVASHARRAKMKNIPGRGVTKAQIIELAKKQPKCPDCRTKFSADEPYTLDHIMPIALGGAHDITNVELRCYSCNNAKRAKDPIDHARSLGRLV